MIYNEYLKKKVINLYLNYQKIGKHSISNNDYDFLNIYFDNKEEIKSNVYSISEILQYIISDYKSNYSLHNKLGIDFLEHLKMSKINSLTLLNLGKIFLKK